MAVSQSGGTAAVCTALATGVAATLSGVDVSGAKASTTYTLSSAGGAGTLTLSDGLGNSRRSASTNICATGTETINFGTLGVKLTIVGGAAKTAANLSTDLAGLTVTTAASTGATFQIGANEGDTLGVSFANAQTSAYAGFDTAVTNFTAGLNSATAGALITATDTAIADVSSIRGGYGAVENRLTHTVSSISVASENLNASESRIKDLDVVSEMVNFTKTQILQQAGTSILAQANSAPQSILTLLRS
jgi:flagellin